MKHMNRRFNKMKREISTKLTTFGMLIRIILILLVLAGGKFFCEKAVDSSVKIYQEK